MSPKRNKSRMAILMIVMIVLSMLSILTGCGNKSDNTYTPIPGLDETQNVVLRIAIPFETNKAMNEVANAFMNKYQNVNIELVYVENYDTNAVELLKQNRLDIILCKSMPYVEYTETNPVTKKKTPDGTTTDDFFYDFSTDTEIDFSDTTTRITENYRETRIDADGNEISYLYCYALGGETRGIFVNTTFLDNLGLSVPTNYSEFLACCEAIKKAGYVPIQGNPSTMDNGLGLAPAANAIVHDEAALTALAAAEEGVSTFCEDTLSKIYYLATHRYCDYKSIEEAPYSFFSNTSELEQCMGFLGLHTDETTFDVIKPENNYGTVAFFPYLSSNETVIQKLIEDNGLTTEFQFIGSPLNDTGNAAIYITPYQGICANKNSENLIWIREFVNFLFQEENITLYADHASIIPNSRNAIQYAAEKYSLDAETDITLCGQIYFSEDYNAYSPISSGLLNTTKCNAQKYMVNLNLDSEGNIQWQTDESGNEFLYLGNGKTVVYKEYIGEADPEKPGYAFCTLQYYLDLLEREFTKYRKE